MSYAKLGKLIREYIINENHSVLKEIEKIIKEASSNEKLLSHAETLAKKAIRIIEEMKKTEIRRKLYKSGGEACIDIGLGNDYTAHICVPSAEISIPLPIEEAEKLFGYPTTLIITPSKIVYNVWRFSVEFKTPKWLSSEMRKALQKIWGIAKSKYRRSKEFELYTLIESLLSSKE